MKSFVSFPMQKCPAFSLILFLTLLIPNNDILLEAESSGSDAVGSVHADPLGCESVRFSHRKGPRSAITAL